MSAQPYSLENTVKGTVGSHSLLTAQVSINRAPSRHNSWTCSCHSFLSADHVCLQTYPAPSASPHPCSTLPKEKRKTYLVSKITHYELKLSISVFTLQLGNVSVSRLWLCFLTSGYGSCSSVVCRNSAMPGCVVVTLYYFRLLKVHASTLRY